MLKIVVNYNNKIDAIGCVQQKSNFATVVNFLNMIAWID